MQYWTGQQLTTVPEGLPMINTPHSTQMWPPSGSNPAFAVRHSTGNIDTRSSAASTAARLSADFNRMSFEETAAAVAQDVGADYPHPAAGKSGPVNPYSSAFFAGTGSDMGRNALDDAEALRRAAW